MKQIQTLKGIAKLLREEMLQTTVEDIDFFRHCLFGIFTDYYEEIGEKAQFVNYVVVDKNDDYEVFHMSNPIAHCDTMEIIKEIDALAKYLVEDFQDENVKRVYINNFSFELSNFRNYKNRIFNKYRKLSDIEINEQYYRIIKRFFKRYI